MSVRTVKWIMQVGSNVFDIWLGLGLPWLVYLPFQDGGKQVINVDRLDSEILILVGVLVTYFSTIVCCGFKLTVKVRSDYTYAPRVGPSPSPNPNPNQKPMFRGRGHNGRSESAPRPREVILVLFWFRNAPSGF